MVEILRELGADSATYMNFLSPRPELYKMVIKELGAYCFPSPLPSPTTCPSSGRPYSRVNPCIYLGDPAPTPSSPGPGYNPALPAECQLPLISSYNTSK